MKKIFIAAVTLSVALIACQKEKEQVKVIDPDQMRLDVRFPGATKATATNFEPGDCIGVFSTVYDGETPRPLQVSGNWINNEAVTFDGTEWTPARKMIWAEGSQDVYAYYPYIGTVPSIEEYNFSVALDQTTEKNGGVLGGYEASDILWAKAEAVSKSGDIPDPVTLNFKHACAKVIIKLIPGEDFSGTFPDDAQMLIHNTVPEGVLDFSTGSVSKYMFGEAETIKCHRVQNPADAEGPVYEAIVIPQRIDSRRPFLEYNTGKISYLAEDTYNFRPGHCYTYTMAISSSPEQIVVSIGGSIEGWD